MPPFPPSLAAAARQADDPRADELAVRRARAKAAADLAEIRREKAQRVAAADPSDPANVDFCTAVLADYDREANALIDAAPPAVRPRIEQEVIAFRPVLDAAASPIEAGARGAQLSAELDRQITADARTAAAVPELSAFFETGFAGELDDLPADARAAVATLYRSEIAKATLTGIAERDGPEAAREVLRSAPLSSDLSAEDVQALETQFREIETTTASAAEQARAQEAVALGAGVREGTVDRAAIEGAVTAGTIARERGEDLLAQFDARQRRIEDGRNQIARVDAALARRGSDIDRDDPAYRAAVDRHYNEVFSPALDPLDPDFAAAETVQYIAAFGFVPEGAGLRFRAGLGSDDPATLVRTAETVARLEAEGDIRMDGLSIDDIAFARAVARNVAAGLSPEDATRFARRDPEDGTGPFAESAVEDLRTGLASHDPPTQAATAERLVTLTKAGDLAGSGLTEDEIALAHTIVGNVRAGLSPEEAVDLARSGADRAEGTVAGAVTAREVEEAQARVRDIFRGNASPLDRDDPDDRRTIEIFLDNVAAEGANLPADLTAGQFADAVQMTGGFLPESHGVRFAGELSSGDPARQLRTARLLNQLMEDGDTVLNGLSDTDLEFARRLAREDMSELDPDNPRDRDMLTSSILEGDGTEKQARE